MLVAVERAWRRLWLGILRGLLRLAGPRAPLDWRSKPCRILFLRPDRLGDAILTTGVLRALTQASPNIRVDVLASPRNAVILRRVGELGEVLVLSLIHI